MKMKKTHKITFILIALALVIIAGICYLNSSTEQLSKSEDKYTEKNLDNDLNLTIEELRAKYPIDWFENRYGKAEWVYQGNCDSGADERTGIIVLPSGEKLNCYPHIDIDKFTDNEIKSIFVHFDYLGYNTTSLVERIYQDLYINKENSK